MALEDNKLSEFSFLHKNQPTNPTMTSKQFQVAVDSQAEELQGKLNSLIDELINSGVDKIKGIKITIDSTPPSNPSTKDIWIDTVNLVLKMWSSSSWVIIGGSSGGGSSGDMLKSIYDTNNNGVVDQAAKLQTPRTIALTGDVTGSGTFDGSSNISISTINNGGGSGGITIVSNISSLPTPSATYRGREYLVQGVVNVWEVNSLTINNPCTTSGNITITLDGIAKTVALTTTSQNTATLVATAIRAASFPGWTTGGSGTTVTFTATVTTVGNRTNGAYSAGSTGATSTAGMTTPTTGVAASPDTHYICVKMGDDTYGWRKLHDTIINVLDYGAKADGSTDDTAAIKRAVNALKYDTVQLGGYIRNRRLYFPAGIYKITDEIVMPFMTGFIIEGESRGSVYIVQHTANKPIFNFNIELTHSWEIRDITLDYNSVQPPTNTRAVHIFFESGASDGFFEMNIENVTFNGGYYGIAINQGIQLAIWGFNCRKSSFWGQTGGAIQLCPGIAVGQPIIKLEDLYIRADSQTQRCIFIGYCDTVLLDSVEINKGTFGTTPQIEITSCYNVTILNSRTEQCAITTSSGGNYFYWNFTNSTAIIIGCTITNTPISGGGNVYLVNANSPAGASSATTGKLTINGLICDAELLDGGTVTAAKADDFIFASGLRTFSPVARYSSNWTPRIDADTTQRNQTTSSGGMAEGNTAVGFGDSLVIGNSDIVNSAFGDASWFQQFLIRSKGKIRYLYNAGISGNTTTQMLARIQTDVVAYKPKICFILGGTNDVGGGISHLTTQSNIEAMITTLVSKGIMPILCTIPPRNDATQAGVAKVNVVINNLATKYGLTLIDFFSVLVNPANGSFKSGLNGGDGIHPNAAGAKAMADLAVTKILPLLPDCATPLMTTNTNPINLLSNGLFLTDTNADGIADSWTVYGGGASTNSLITSDTSILGNWGQMVVTSSATRIFENTITTGFVVGNKLSIFGKINVIAEAGSATYDLKLTFNGSSSTIKLLSNWTKDLDGTFYHEFTVPTATTSISFAIINLSGTGTYKLAQVGIVNLTQNSLIIP